MNAWQIPSRCTIALLFGTTLSLVLATTSIEFATPFHEGIPTNRGELDRGPMGARRVALTFDAGGEADAFPALIAALADARVRSTFFLTGQWMRRYPALVDVLVNSGHELGNHTWSHHDLTRLDDAQIRIELQQARALLAQHLGRTPCRWWRAPFGARDRRVLRIASELGYLSVYWTIDSLDSVPPQKTADLIIERITRRTDLELEGAIILMHVGEPATTEAVPEIVRVLERRGFQPVTVSGLVGPDRSKMLGTRVPQTPLSAEEIPARTCHSALSRLTLIQTP